MRKAASYFLLVLLLPFGVGAQIITTVVGTGVAGYSGDGGPASAAKLNHPDRIIFDHSGNMYIADENNHVIRKVNTSGIISTIAGTGTPGYSGDGGPATLAQISRPGDIIFDQYQNLYIASNGNGTIRKVTPTGIISTIAGTGISGSSGDGGPATAAQISDPLGLVFDTAGNLYFSNNGTYRIRKINTSGIISTVVGTGVAGYSGDSGPAAAAQIRLTGYLAINSMNELYVSDYQNHRVRKVDASGIITTVGGNGTTGNTGDGGPLSAAVFTSPFAIMFDPSWNMYISDRVLGVIRKVNTSGIISTIAGIGTAGYGGDGGPATAAQFNTDVIASAIDAWGNLYLADPVNNRIRRINYDNSAVNDINTTTLHADIYPNPASNEVMIKADVVIEDVAIVNIIGQVEPSHKSSQHVKEAMHDISDLPSGIYFVKVNGMYAGRFVKE